MENVHELVHIRINGTDLSVPKGTTIHEAAKLVNADIPTLCHLNLEGFGMVNSDSLPAVYAWWK